MDKSRDIGRLFDGIAPTYDRFNHLLSFNIDRRWRRYTVGKLNYAGELLDVATGTADLAIEIVRRNKAGHVTGMDISTGMMQIGQGKVDALSMQNRISFFEGSALDIPFESCSFDAVTCAYGVRNFSDLDRGLAEMYRVLRPGGQLAVLEFSYPENPVVRKMYDIFFSHIMPAVGRAVSNDKGAYLYFRESVKGFIWGEEMVSRISAAGFSKVSCKVMSFGITTLYTASK